MKKKSNREERSVSGAEKSLSCWVSGTFAVEGHFTTGEREQGRVLKERRTEEARKQRRMGKKYDTGRVLAHSWSRKRSPDHRAWEGELRQREKEGRDDRKTKGDELKKNSATIRRGC